MTENPQDEQAIYRSPLLQRQGAVEAAGADAGTADHYGQPVREQRELAAGRALVDLSQRSVVTVSGPDRLSWLTTLSSQQLTNLSPGESAEALLLDISGRIEHDVAVVDDGQTVWLFTEGDHGAALFSWLDSMRFALRVEVQNRSADVAVLGSVGELPSTALQLIGDQQISWDDPWPQLGAGAQSYAMVPEEDHPGAGWDWRLTALPRRQLDDVVDAALEAGWTLAGAGAYEALRLAAWRPRLAQEVDEKAIPHELDLIRTAVHLSKGCYRGQETVARVHNLGHPPRRLVFLQLDGSEHTLPRAGSDVLAPSAETRERARTDPAGNMAGERSVGRVTSVARHHEMGPIALAVVKRRVDPEAPLVVRDDSAADGDGDAPATYYAAAQEPIVRPDAGQAVGRPKGDFLRTPRR